MGQDNKCCNSFALCNFLNTCFFVFFFYYLTYTVDYSDITKYYYVLRNVLRKSCNSSFNSKKSLNTP